MSLRLGDLQLLLEFFSLFAELFFGRLNFLVLQSELVFALHLQSFQLGLVGLESVS